MAIVRFFNRYTGQEDLEVIYGESFLKWTYETNTGRLGLWLLARRAVFSRWYGWRMSRPASAAKIRPFIRDFGLDETIFRDEVASFKTFNEFFYRKLKPGARPIVDGTDTVALPADARHLAVPHVGMGEGLYAKGQRFDLAAFLGNEAIAERYRDGRAVISRLCPVDYHRYHSPVSGRIVEQRLINGWLYSVSPIALRRRARYLWENKRVLNLIETEAFGTVAFVAIGATCVGTIAMTAGLGDEVAKGDELGYFAFGGSCVVTLFERGRIELAGDLAAYGPKQIEVYARMGDRLGTASGL